MNEIVEQNILFLSQFKQTLGILLNMFLGRKNGITFKKNDYNYFLRNKTARITNDRICDFNVNLNMFKNIIEYIFQSCSELLVCSIQEFSI